MGSEQHSKPVRLAGAALQAKLAGQHQRAADLVKRISDECGGSGLYTALVGWCDTYADHATDGHADTMRPGQAKTIRADTGQLHNPRTQADDLPKRVVWASSLIEARAGMDHERFNVVIAALPDDGVERAAYIMQVLQSVALTINGLPRGFARMGRGVA